MDLEMTIQTTTSIVPRAPDGVPAGFVEVTDQIKKRMILSIEGDWGTGKTDLALTAPGPIAFFKFDLNTEVTLAKYARKKRIYMREYDVVDPNDRDAQTKAETMMKRFWLDYAACLESKTIRTVIWDTATEVWEQVRLAAFGRLTNIMPHHYVQVNNGFRNAIRAAFDSDTNLILIHRLKDEWVNVPDPKDPTKEKGKRTGRKERAGFSDLGFAVQVMVQTFFDPDDAGFQVKVLKCTQNPILTHRVYAQVGDMRTNSFPCLATDVFPGTDLAEWS